MHVVANDKFKIILNMLNEFSPMNFSGAHNQQHTWKQPHNTLQWEYKTIAWIPTINVYYISSLYTSDRNALILIYWIMEYCIMATFLNNSNYFASIFNWPWWHCLHKQYIKLIHANQEYQGFFKGGL